MSRERKKLIRLLALEKEAELKEAQLALEREKLELQRLKRNEKLQRHIHKRGGWRYYVV